MRPSRHQVHELRALIVDAAAQVPSIGPLEESVKWGQPSFAPKRANVGSSVRIEERANGDHALMFICTTGLVDQFRDLYSDVLTFDGKRAIVLPQGAMPDREALQHCIQLALTHKLRKRVA